MKVQLMAVNCHECLNELIACGIQTKLCRSIIGREEGARLEGKKESSKFSFSEDGDRKEGSRHED